jgi:SRSO17 transposase
MGCNCCCAGAGWGIDAVRDEMRGYVVEHLGDPDGVLTIDHTGFLKNGVKPVDVARQYRRWIVSARRRYGS